MRSAKSYENSKKLDKFSSVEWLTNQAVKKHKEGKSQEAIAFYLEILDKNKERPEWIYGNAVTLLAQVGRLDESLELGEKALAIYPTSEEIHRALGLAYENQSNNQKCIEHYKAATEANCQQPEWVYVKSLELLLQANQSDKAVEIWQKGIKQHPQSQYIKKFQLEILAKQEKWEHIQTAIATDALKENNGIERIASSHAYKINEHVIYFEFNYHGNWNFDKLEFLNFDRHNKNKPKTYWFIYTENCISCVFFFPQKIDFERLEVLAASTDRQAVVDVYLTNTFTGLELVQYINSKSNYSKCILKENIIRGIIKNSQSTPIEFSQKTIKKLQSFIQISPQLCNNIQEPFGIHFDRIIPIQCEGLFIDGWMSDPFDLLEEINAISCLGFSISFKDYIHFVDRPDMNEAIANTPYKGINKRLGIMAYIPFPPEIKHKFQPYVRQCSFRFNIKLQDNIVKELIPQATYYNSSFAMTNLLNSCESHKANTSLLRNCLIPAILDLGKTSKSQSARVKIENIGPAAVDNPLASIIITINKNFELFKVQFAALANDKSVRNSELIYVLNSLDKKEYWQKAIETYSNLYSLPVKLIILDAEDNYGTLTNVGVAKSKSSICISLHRDVLPKTPNWVTLMVNFYQSLTKPGVVTPKLIYEDLSIQHAGMSYEKTDANTWNYKYFHQGLSSNYSLAQNSYPVPGVNGACMMFSRQLHQQTKGLSENYLMSESEASDFCLRSRDLGYENWYFSGVEMYYFEKHNYFTEIIERHSLNLMSKKWNHLMVSHS